VTSGAAGDRQLEGLSVPTLNLEPLLEEAAEQLLFSTAPELPQDVAAAVLRGSAGLPLALVELGSAARREGHAIMAGSLPLTDRLEQTYGRALGGMPLETVVLLRMLSFGETRAVAELLAAGASFLDRPVGLDELQPALESRLVEISADGFEVWFASPTARAVVSALTPAADRHRVHLAWADSLRDPDRSLWHRAAGTLGPDLVLEEQLVGLADRAVQHDDLDIATAALEQAARFADDPRRVGHLLVRAAGHALELDDPERSAHLVAAINNHALAPVDRARLRWLNGMRGEVWTGADTLPPFVDIARQIHEAGDDRLAFDALMGVCLRFYFTNPDDVVRTSADELLSVLELDSERDLQRLGGYALISPGPRSRDILDRITRTSPAEVGESESLVMMGYGALALGDPIVGQLHLAEAESRCRAAGRLGTLTRALVSRAFAAVLSGRAGLARAYATEGRALGVETGQTRWVITADLALGLVAALRGEADEAARLATTVETIVTNVGLFAMLSYVEITRGLIAAAAGEPGRAVEHLIRPFTQGDPAFHPQVRFWGLTHLAFTAVAAGRRDVLDGAVRAARDANARTPAPVLSNALVFAEAVSAPDRDAPAAFEVALDTISTDWPFERARIQLSYGSWLRRHHRPDEAHPHLQAAAAVFTHLGTKPWADSAQREIHAAGGTVGQAGSAVDALSPQELQVATLVSEGLTNRQIAERLFLSPRTIESHLYRIYAKVGAANRTDLARMVTVGPTA
jgi:DNA-binding CsgD family transcriptional regulator